VSWIDFVTVAVLAVMGVRLASGARVAFSDRGREHIAEIVKGLRPRHFLLAPFVFALVLFTYVGLSYVPGMEWGWWTAIGGVGNPVFGSTDRTTGTALEWAVPLVFLLLLFPALPLFAEAEERIFRLGSERRSTFRRILKAIQFGLVHALIGIPIGVALALSLGGGYFTVMYLRGYRQGGQPGGLLESTRAHLAYNGEILLLAITALLTL
jgi:hypothetical protein